MTLEIKMEYHHRRNTSFILTLQNLKCKLTRFRHEYSYLSQVGPHPPSMSDKSQSQSHTTSLNN